MLIEDVKIFLHDKIRDKTHLTINSGTYFASDKLSNCGRYLYNGYLPIPDWKTLNQKQRNILISVDENGGRHNTIAIGKIPKSLLEYSQSIGVHELKTPDEAIKFTKSDVYENLKKGVFNFFYDYLENTKGLCILKLACQSNSLEVSTFNHQTNRLLGLHFDSWDALHCTHRDFSRNRMCINFGKEERHFLFVNLTLKKVIMQAQIDVKFLKENNDILHVFFSKFPEYEVIKLRLNPGEYYIAPTENILHDGCTFGKTSPDVFLTILGSFKICPSVKENQLQARLTPTLSV